MEEETAVFVKSEPQSKIFNTSVRGWIALLLAGSLSISLFMIVVAPFVDVSMPERISDQLIALFSAGFGSAVTQYFNQKSKEGQSKP